MLMYWRLWRLYQLLLQFMNRFLFGSTELFFPSLSAQKTCEDPDLQPALSVLFHNVCSMLCSLKDPWSVAHKHNTRVCVCVSNHVKPTKISVWIGIGGKKNKNKKLGEIHRNRLLVDGAVTTWKKSNRHPAEATLATTSETLDRGDGLSV